MLYLPKLLRALGMAQSRERTTRKDYDPSDKFTQPPDGIVFISAGPTDDELREIGARVQQSEDRSVVEADIETRGRWAESLSPAPRPGTT